MRVPTFSLARIDRRRNQGKGENERRERINMERAAELDCARW